MRVQTRFRFCWLSGAAAALWLVVSGRGTRKVGLFSAKSPSHHPLAWLSSGLAGPSGWWAYSWLCALMAVVERGCPGVWNAGFGRH